MHNEICLYNQRAYHHYKVFVFFFLMIRRPPRSTLFPSPPLSRPHSTPVAAATAGRSRRPMSGCMSARCFTRSEEHTSELQSRQYLVCRLLLEKKKKHERVRCLLLVLLSSLRPY